MESAKMSSFYSSSTELSQSPTNVPNLHLMPISSSPKPMQSSTHPMLSLKVEEPNAFLESLPSSSSASVSATSATSSVTYNDPFSAYADNFDLSLLPQTCTSSNLENIPTLLNQFNYNTSTTTLSTPTTSQLQLHAKQPATTTFVPNNNNLLTPPQIKIEQTWSYGSSISLPEEIKSEPQLSLLKSTPNLLIPPPPPYPHIYPSPQSSPVQSEYGFPQTPFLTNSYDSLNTSLKCATSPYHPSSFDVSNIKQELHILPPSPPESNCEASSPHSSWIDIKSEPLDADVETLIDLNKLLDNTGKRSEYQLKSTITTLGVEHKQQHNKEQQEHQQNQDHQMICEFFAENHFPLGNDMDEMSGNIEKVISMALEDTKSQAVETCAKLQISKDPCDWSVLQVHSWLRSTVAQFKLPEIEDLENKFPENGAALILLTEEDFKRRVPVSGSDLYAQLEVWRYHFNSNDVPDSDDDEDMLPTTRDLTLANGSIERKRIETKRSGRTGGSHIHLWQFLKELLSDPHTHGTAIRWIDRNRGIFKIEDSVRVAKLWGGRKNRPAMNYDKLSRSIRQYYKKGIMKKTERSQRLVYQFCHPYQL